MGVARRNGQLSQVLSPREWGCTEIGLRTQLWRWVVPTRVGVYPGTIKRLKLVGRCPHASGGVPARPGGWFGSGGLSPREWGCTDCALHLSSAQGVVPTRVGVYHSLIKEHPQTCCCPHASGGVPDASEAWAKHGRLSPREWGCTSISPYSHPLTIVVPTRVGVYREIMQVRLVPECCPHASGGVPRYRRCSGPYHALSPREWGCTGALMQITYPTFVVPTRVGVYRRA